MAAAAADLDRFDSDSDDAAAPPRASTGACTSPSGNPEIGGGDELLSKAARVRAKKASSRAAQKQRRRSEMERFPKQVPVVAVAVGNGRNEKSDDDDDTDGDDEETNAKPSVKKHGNKNNNNNAAFAEKTHHGALNVEGVFVDEMLYLLDRRSGYVYSSTKRSFDGTHLRVGVWDEETQTVDDLSRDEIEAQMVAPVKTKKEDEGDETEEPENTVELRMEKPPTEVSHDFAVDPDDHCETSPEAHKHVVNFLAKTAEFLGKKPSELVIYDPYYCAGGTQRSFKALGFSNVINENKDFYEVVKNDEVPEHDVLVTNPPYSEDHVEKCLRFAALNCARHDRPYFLLLPSYVINKPYYVDALLTGGAAGKALREKETVVEVGGVGDEKQTSGDESEESEDEESEPEAEPESQSESEEKEMKVHDPSTRGKSRGKIRDLAVKRHKDGTVDTRSRKQTLPFYVAPFKRYYYWTPKALAAERRNKVQNDGKKKKKGHVGRLGERTSPFPSFWYCGLGDALQTDALRWHRKLPKAMVDGYSVASHPNDLPLHVLDEWDPRRAKLLEQAEKDALAKNWKNGGKSGTAKKPPPRRFAGFSGANCGQNMPAKAKAKYAEFSNDSSSNKGDKNKTNWGNGKGQRDREGAMFVRPRKKSKY